MGKLIRSTGGSNEDIEDGKNKYEAYNTIVYVIKFMLFVLIIYIDSHYVHQNHT